MGERPRSGRAPNQESPHPLPNLTGRVCHAQRPLEVAIAFDSPKPAQVGTEQAHMEAGGTELHRKKSLQVSV